MVTAIYTVAPHPRTADDIVAVLVDPQAAQDDPAPRPEPTGKRIFGTMHGKQAAFEHLAGQVQRYQSLTLCHRVILTDGDRGLHTQAAAILPDFTLVLDIIHVAEYLWDAATVLLGETHPQRHVWVEDALRCLLEDDHDTLFAHLAYQLTHPDLSSAQTKALQKVLTYLQNNRPYMDYQAYLAAGWPIAKGVIEGACRHLVKDRFERSGMRWIPSGAHVMLQLRSVAINDDWDDFQRFRRHRTHRQRFGSPHPEEAIAA
jgi:hypothetical protein